MHSRNLRVGPQTNRMVWWFVSIGLLSLWGLGIATNNTLGGIVHVLFAFAVGILLIRVVQRRRALNRADQPST